MKQLSKTEKKIVDKLCEDSQYFSSLVAEYLENALIAFDKDLPSLTIQLKKDSKIENDDYVDKARFITEKVIAVISFLMYLRDNRLVLTGYFSHGRSSKGAIGEPALTEEFKKEPSDFVGWNFTEEDLYDTIFELLNLQIIPTETLKSYKDKGYRTIDDVRHLENKYISWTAIILSFFIGVVPTIYDACTNNDDENQKKIIQSHGQEAFELNLIKQELDTINSTIHLVNTASSSNKTQPQTQKK